jgi:hypothetical protein
MIRSHYDLIGPGSAAPEIFAKEVGRLDSSVRKEWQAVTALLPTVA